MKFSLTFCISTLSVLLLVDLVTSQNYVMPVPGDCTKYQVCDYSGCFVFNCGIGTEFNPRILVCDYPLRDRGACGSRGVPGPFLPYPGRDLGGYPGGNPGYPGGNPGYPGGNPGYPGGTPGYPGGNPGYPSAGGYPQGAGGAAGCPGAANPYPGNSVC